MLCDFRILSPTVSFAISTISRVGKRRFCKTFLLLLIQQLRRRPVLTFSKTFSFHQYHTGGDPVCSLPANFFIFSFTTTTVGGFRFAKRATKKQQIFFKTYCFMALWSGLGAFGKVGEWVHNFYLALYTSTLLGSQKDSFPRGLDARFGAKWGL